MNKQHKHSMFTLLYAMALIDNRVIKVEVDEFFSAIEDFLQIIDLTDPVSTKANLSDWLLQNYKKIRTAMKSKTRIVFLLEHVEELKLNEHRQAIFDMMKKIAIADNVFHPSEHQFLEKVAKVWGLDAAA